MKRTPLLYLPKRFDGGRCGDAKSVIEKVSFEGSFNSPAELAVYRWVVGHQTLALVMKLAALELSSLKMIVSQEDRAQACSRALGYVEMFSYLLHYTVSWSAETYLQSVRPSMMGVHPSFSGLWWSEVHEFKALLSELSNDCPAEHRAVAMAYGAFWQQHSQLKKHLPVDGSLYQDGANLLTPDFDYADYFDLYFKIVRKDGTESLFLDQLVTRLDLITSDVEVHGLYEDSPLLAIEKGAFLERHRDLIKEAEATIAAAAKQPRQKPFRKDHIAIQVRDVAETVRWYEAFFGARLMWRMDGGFSETTTSRLPTIRSLVELRLDQLTFHIFDSEVADTYSQGAALPGFQHFGIEVPSQAILNEMHARWFELKGSLRNHNAAEIAATDIITEDDGTQLFYCTDPNGLEFEIIHRPQR